MDLIATGGRVVLSLAAVLALVWLLAQAARRRGAGGVVLSQDFAVLTRQSLGRTAGVAVVRVGDQALVLGVTEHSVRLLTQTALSDVIGAQEIPASAVDGPSGVDGPGGPSSSTALVALPRQRPVPAGRSALAGSALAGSALSPATWSRAVGALRERSTRR